MKEKWLKYKLIYTLFLVLTFLFYGNSLKNKYALDDDYITVTNIPVKGQPFTPNNNLMKDGIKSIPKIWLSRYAHDSEASFDYRPVVTTTFAIEYSIFGQNPFVSHLINIILFFIVICLLFNVLLILFEHQKEQLLLAFISSLLFLIHPIHTEVVDSLKCRDELLATMFSLIALTYSFSFLLKPSIKDAAVIILFLFLAFFSKLSAVLLMTAIPLMFLFYRKPQLKKTILISLGLIILYHLFQLFMNSMPEEELKRVFYRFENPLFTENFSFLDKIFIGIKTFGFYIQMLFFPYPLRYYYGSNMFDFSSTINGYFIVSIIFILTSIIYYWKTKNNNFLFSFLLLGLLMFPFLNILTPVAGILGERLMFIPSIAFCILISVSLSPLFKDFKIDKISLFFSKPLIYLTGLIFIAMIYTINRNSKWYDKITLFENDIPYLTNSAKANSLIANEYFEMLRSTNKPKYQPQILIQKCIKHYSQSVTSDSSFFSAYNNAGVVYYSYLKDFTRAKKLFTLAIRHKPIYSQAYENLGNCYKQESQIAKAKWCYEKSFEINPMQYSAYIAAMTMFFDIKKYDECLDIIKKARSKIQNNYELIAQEANCYLMKKDMKKALNKYEEAYLLNPNKNLAQFLSKKYLENGDTVNYNKFKGL
jgi:tetratricopeptide (TPR) repeat protein